MAYVAAEVKQPQRNIVRTLVIGTTIVTVLYILINGAFLSALGYVKMAGSFIDTILYTAPVVWVFFLATGLSVFVLRRKEPQNVRPYQGRRLPHDGNHLLRLLYFYDIQLHLVCFGEKTCRSAHLGECPLSRCVHLLAYRRP